MTFGDVPARVFVDTSHFIAVLNPRDDLAGRAFAALAGLRRARFSTTDAVVTEVFDYFSGMGPYWRLTATFWFDAIRTDRSFTIQPVTAEILRESVRLYRSRRDKGYSLVDCISMVVCHRQRIRDVLPHDHHFRQEGFRVLL